MRLHYDTQTKVMRLFRTDHPACVGIDIKSDLMTDEDFTMIEQEFNQCQVVKERHSELYYALEDIKQKATIAISKD